MHRRGPMIRRSVLGLAALSFSSILGTIAACGSETIIKSAPAPEEAGAPEADTGVADVERVVL